MTKQELRKDIAARIAALSPDYCREADAAIRERVAALPEYPGARTVFCYVGTSREIDTLPLIGRMLSEGKRVGVPLCTGRGLMEVREIRSVGELRTGAYDIPAPPEDAPLIPPEEIDLCLVPCVTANRRGERLGYGGGFYDRFLPKTQCKKILLLRERLLTEKIPTEPHDLVMDRVVTEQGMYDKD